MGWRGPNAEGGGQKAEGRKSPGGVMGKQNVEIVAHYGTAHRGTSTGPWSLLGEEGGLPGEIRILTVCHAARAGVPGTGAMRRAAGGQWQCLSTYGRVAAESGCATCCMAQGALAAAGGG